MRQTFEQALIALVNMFLTKTTATKNEATFSFHRLHELHFLAVVFVRSIVMLHIFMVHYFLYCIETSEVLFPYSWLSGIARVSAALG